MQQEIRLATFNVCNLAPPGMVFYPNLPAYTEEEYRAKVEWIARALDTLDADVIGLQEIFSQGALKDVLARSEKYRDAWHVGIDPDPMRELTPSVALVSRLPLAAAGQAIADFAPDLAARLPALDGPHTRFTRPVLHVPITAPNGSVIHVVVVHLKSKRPDFHDGEDENDAATFGIASLRSLYRRGAEALGLRDLLTRLMSDGAPLFVMGDFNDVAEAVTTELVMGSGRADQENLGPRLFDCRRLQRRHGHAREVGYTHVHDGGFNTIDHVLASRHFHPDCADALGTIEEVLYLNDHVLWRRPQATDHGLVLVRATVAGGE